jgi:transaldolase
MNPLIALREHGQSVWLDYISRELLKSGDLKRLVEEDGLRGLTSNPTIFENAIGGSSDYDESIQAITESEPGIDVHALYERLAIQDIQMAADVLKPVFDETEGNDGYVSFEVSPHLAYDTEATIAEAHRLWDTVDRPNLMIKVPATKDGIPAIEELIKQGVNVNVTLMFSIDHYEAVASAYIHGLENNANPGKIASVASFFVSRVDTAVDLMLEAIGSDEARALMGKVAVANSQRAYRRFREIFHGDTFAAQRARGARVQRTLWGSTSAKNPDYSDVIYVENLVGPDTVNTMPLVTMNAFRDHGHASDIMMKSLEEADNVLAKASSLGINLEAVTGKLQTDGVKAFADSYDKLIATLDQKRRVIAKV